MRFLWNVISFLAVVHLLALLMFLAWLWQSDRLSGARVEAVRSIFGPTIAEAESSATLARKEAAAADERLADEQRRRTPSLSSAERVRALTGRQQAEDRALRRINDVKAQLSREIAMAEAQMAERQQALEADRRELDGGRETDEARRAEEQMSRTIKLLESLPPRQAKAQIVHLVETQRTDRAVAYLNGMSPRAAAKVLREFKTDQESQLATELLERIRTLGLSDPDGQAGVEERADADPVANSG